MVTYLTDLEELKNICALGLSVWLSDPTREIVEEISHPSIYSSNGVRILTRAGSKGDLPLSWMKFKDVEPYATLYEDDLRIFDTVEGAYQHLHDMKEERRKLWNSLKRHTTQA